MNERSQKRPHSAMPRRQPREHDTAARLIRAGRTLFARRGYDGASVRALTAAAGVNLGAITYHFGSKRGLYGAVVTECLTPLAKRVEAVAAGAGTPLARVEAIVRAYFDHLSHTPELPQLMMQEVVVGRAAPAEAVAVVERLARAIGGVVRAGQADGSIRRGDPLLATLSIVSQPLWMLLALHMFSEMLSGPAGALPGLDAVVAHAVRFVRHGLRNEPEESEP